MQITGSITPFMKQGLILVALVLSIFASAFGCSDDSSVSLFATANCAYEIPCHDSSTDQHSETDQHHECPTHCTHTFLTATNAAVPTFDSRSAKYLPYSFYYKSQHPDTIERPPLFA